MPKIETKKLKRKTKPTAVQEQVSVKEPIENDLVQVETSVIRDVVRNLKATDDARFIVEEMCEALGGVTPLALLAGNVNGVDIRNKSLLFRILREVEQNMISDCTEVPDVDDWKRISDTIRVYYFFETVTVEESNKAAKALIDVTMPKLKQIEMKPPEEKSPFEDQDIDFSRLSVKELTTFNKLLRKLKGETE